MHRLLSLAVLYLWSCPALISGLPKSSSRLQYTVDSAPSLDDNEVKTVQHEFNLLTGCDNRAEILTVPEFDSGSVCQARIPGRGARYLLEEFHENYLLYRGKWTNYDFLPRNLRLVKCNNFKGKIIDLASLNCPPQIARRGNVRRVRRSGAPIPPVCKMPEYLLTATPSPPFTTTLEPQGEPQHVPQ